MIPSQKADMAFVQEAVSFLSIFCGLCRKYGAMGRGYIWVDQCDALGYVCGIGCRVYKSDCGIFFQ